MKFVPRKKLVRLIVSFCAIVISGCTVISSEGIQSVSSAPNNQGIVFSYFKGNGSLIATNQLDGNPSKILLRSPEGTFYERPIYSSDGSKIFFIAKASPDQGDLYALDVDGSGLEQITKGQEGAENVRDFALSRDGQTIYYINSGFYGHYSPIAKSAPHEMDYYSIRRDGTGIKRLTRLKSYSLNGLSVPHSSDEIYSRQFILKLKGPQAYTPFNPGRLMFPTSRYPLSNFSQDGKFLVSSGKVERKKPGFKSAEWLPTLKEGYVVYGYGLYLLDTENLKQVKEIIHLPSLLDSPTVLHDHGIIFFIRFDKFFGGDAGSELWSVNLDGSGLRRINLQLHD